MYLLTFMVPAYHTRMGVIVCNGCLNAVMDEKMWLATVKFMDRTVAKHFIHAVCYESYEVHSIDEKYQCQTHLRYPIESLSHFCQDNPSSTLYVNSTSNEYVSIQRT